MKYFSGISFFCGFFIFYSAQAFINYALKELTPFCAFFDYDTQLTVVEDLSRNDVYNVTNKI